MANVEITRLTKAEPEEPISDEARALEQSLLETYAIDTMRMNYYKYIAAGMDPEKAKAKAGFHENGDVIPFKVSKQAHAFKAARLEYFGALQADGRLKGVVRTAEWTSNDKAAFALPPDKFLLRSRSLAVNLFLEETLGLAMRKGFSLPGRPLAITALVAAQDTDQLEVLDDLLVKALGSQDQSRDVYAVHARGDIAREVTEAYGFVSTKQRADYDGLEQELFVREA